MSPEKVPASPLLLFSVHPHLFAVLIVAQWPANFADLSSLQIREFGIHDVTVLVNSFTEVVEHCRLLGSVLATEIRTFTFHLHTLKGQIS